MLTFCNNSGWNYILPGCFGKNIFTGRPRFSKKPKIYSPNHKQAARFEIEAQNKWAVGTYEARRTTVSACWKRTGRANKEGKEEEEESHRVSHVVQWNEAKT